MLTEGQEMRVVLSSMVMVALLVPCKYVFNPMVNLQSWSAGFPHSKKPVELSTEVVLDGDE